MIARPAQGDVLEVGTDGVVTIAASDGGGVTTLADPVARQLPEAAPDVPEAALTRIAAPTVPKSYEASLASAAAVAGVSPALLEALVWQESRWRADAVSPKGARGLTQLMPGTARALAVVSADPSANLTGGARYLRAQLDRFDGDIEKALAAYNAGPARVARARGVPAIAETRAYVASIINRLGSADSADTGVAR